MRRASVSTAQFTALEQGRLRDRHAEEGPAEPGRPRKHMRIGPMEILPVHDALAGRSPWRQPPGGVVSIVTEVAEAGFDQVPMAHRGVSAHAALARLTNSSSSSARRP